MNDDDPLRTTNLDPAQEAKAGSGPRTTNLPRTPKQVVTEHGFDHHAVEMVPADRDIPRPEPEKQLPTMPSIAGYHLIAELGRGGMGVVYKARHLSLNRKVAVKMILGNADAVTLARFRIEAEVVARLHHPGIVQIHEIGVHDGKPFCALEFVEGGTLAQKLGGKPLTMRDAAQMVEALARAMQVAHSRNVVHRDLKPANVLLTPEGLPKVSDFGLARQLDVDGGQTHMGAVMGTPNYMAPEQASGRTHEAGPVADVYALGAILYECLTGRPPFRGRTTIETLDHVRTREPVPPSRLQPRVTRDLETICLKCLRKEPERRYSSAAELADDLKRFLQGEPVQARPIGTLERGRLWCRRNPVVAALLLAVALTLVVGASVASFFAVRAEQRRQEADRSRKETEQAFLREAEQLEKEKEARKEAQDARAHSDKLLARSRRLAYTRQLALAQREWQAGKIDLARDLLMGCPWDLRDWEYRHIAALCEDRKPAVLRIHEGSVLCVAISTNGKRIVSGGEDGTLKVLETGEDQPRLTLKGHTGHITGVAFCLDGNHIVSAGQDGILRVWNLTTGQTVRTLTGHQGVIDCLAVTSDGTQVVSAGQDATVRIWDAATGKSVRVIEKSPNNPIFAMSVAISPDNRWIAAGCHDFTLRVWEMADGKPVHILRGYGHAVTCVAFSPDGKHLAGGGFDRTIKLWDVAEGREVLTLNGHVHPVGRLTYTSDGKRLISAGEDGSIKVWDVETGQETLSWPAHEKPIRGFAISADGCRLVTSGWDHTIRIWESLPDVYPFIVPPQTMSVRCVAFSPDGKLLLGSGGMGDICFARTWDNRTGEPLVSFLQHRQTVRYLAVSPDNTHVAGGAGEFSDPRLIGELKVWNVADGSLRWSLPGSFPGVCGLAFSPDGEHLVAGFANDSLRILNAKSGEERFAIPAQQGGITSVAYRPDGQHILSSGLDGTVKVWDAATGRPVYAAVGHKGVIHSAAYSPDGRSIAAAGVDQTIVVWDADSGKEIRSFPAHDGAIMSLAFATNTRIVSGSVDRTVRVWDATTGKLLQTFKGYEGSVWSVACTADGRYVAGGCHDRTIRVWRIVD